jgi:hypothetical protein
MTTQYTIRINYSITEKTASVGEDVIQPIMDKMVKEMKNVGWSVHQDQVQDGLNIRFWLNEKVIEEATAEEMESRMRGFRGVLVKITSRFFGNHVGEQSLTIAKNLIKEKIEKQASHEIEKELR